MKQYKHLYDKLFIRSANSIYDLEFARHLQLSGFIDRLFNDPSNQVVQEEYLSFYQDWICSSLNNNIHGLENFPFKFNSLGVTQLLDYTVSYALEHKLRLRIFKGEYPYIRDSYKFSYDQFIENSDIKQNDIILISHPFSGTGTSHPNLTWLFEKTLSLNVPIILDCAFYGTCSNILFDFNHENILMVGFSTTKGLSCGNYRSGIVFSKINTGALAIQTKWKHGIHINNAISLELMKNFTPDYLHNKYYESYKIVINYLNLTETNCIHLALGDINWNYFNRDKMYNRIGIKELVKQVYKRGNISDILNE